MNTSYNMMSVKLSILGTFVSLMALPVMAHAFVTLSSDPLFNATNLVPGQVLTGTITLENPTEDTLSAQIQATDASEESALANAMRIKITEGEATLYDETLNTFFGGSLVPLSSVSGGDVTTYTVALIFDSEASPALMGASLGFDLCVGFAGETAECGTAFPPASDDSSVRYGSRKSEARTTPIQQVLGESTQACSPYLVSTIRPDQANDPAEIVKLQTFLRDLEGHTALEITGVYDEATQAAIRAFQEKYRDKILRPWGLPVPTSIVYLTTRKAINEIHCQFTIDFPLTTEQEAEIARYRDSGVAYRTESASSSGPTGLVEGISSVAESVIENGQEAASAIGEQAAAAASAGAGFWGTITNFFKSIFSW